LGQETDTEPKKSLDIYDNICPHERHKLASRKNFAPSAVITMSKLKYWQCHSHRHRIALPCTALFSRARLYGNA